ncbi:MAG: hypothetical protein VYC61_00700 [Candidatus Neomarinimicrobiota bacterium]|nr:hypothetical protein [Candidatus Neomarinimicrobiota bacterium]
MKKIDTLILPIAFLFLIAGCAKDEPKGISDAELVQAIIDAEGKVEVTMADLPTAARGTMEENYLNDYLHLYSMKASMLGYEVSIAGRPGNSGKRGEVYFDIDGRKLDPDDYGDDYKDWYGERDGFDRDNFGEKRNWNCFDIVYPITIMLPNGSSYLIDSEEDSDLETIKSYYEENQGADERPSIIFPVNIIDHEGETKAINSEEEMEDAYRHCSGRDRDKRECFGLVFPVTYIMPDGSSYEIADDDDESWAELKAWYDANPEAEERPELQYPVDIMYESEDRTVTISNEEEMLAAKEECREMWGADEEEYEECFDYVYPIAFTMPDGSSIEIPSDDETSWMSIRAYYEANPSDEEPVLQYPIDIIFRTEEGEVTFTMDSEEDVDSFVEERCERP